MISERCNMKRLTTISAHLDNLGHQNETEIKRIRKGGGAFPFVNFIAIYQDGKLHCVNITFGKSENTHSKDYDFVGRDYTQTTIQTVYPIDEVRDCLLSKEIA